MAPAGKKPKHDDRLTRLRRVFKDLSYEELIFLGALEEFLDHWPDHKVVNEFALFRRLVPELARLKTGQAIYFDLPKDGEESHISVQRVKEIPEGARELGSACVCMCFDGRGQCVFCQCPDCDC